MCFFIFVGQCMLLVTWQELMVITIDSGLSHTPRTHSDGQPSLFSFSAVRLANSLVRESRVCVCKIFCIRKEGYHPL